MTAVLDAALVYAARGWHVVPLHSIGPDGRCTCAAPGSGRVCDSAPPAPGKHPRTGRGHHEATIDETTIREWWSRWPDANVGIALEPSGLVALDVDVGPGKRGRESLAAIDADLSATLTARSGSGGLHALYARPEGVTPARKIGRENTTHPGLDLLGDGYIVAAPSRHVSGGAYAWVDAGAAVAPLPPVLVEMARAARPAAPASDVSPRGPASDRVIRAARDRLDRHGPAIEGQGGNAHTRAAWGLLVHNYGLSEAEAMPLLAAWNLTCKPPWEFGELRKGPARGGQDWTGPYAVERDGVELGEAMGDIDAWAGTPSSAPDDVGDEPDAPMTLGALAPPPPAEASGSDEYGGSLIEFLGDDDPGDDEDTWLIRGVLAAGVPQVIAGTPKSRKTFVMEHQAISIAAGIDWLGKFPTKRGRVLVLPREDSFRETRRRIWRLARGLGLDPRDLDGWLRIDSRTPFYFSSPADVNRMRRTIEAWKPDLILIDSLSRTHQGDENSVKEMSIVTSTWGDLCQGYDIALPMIHHLTKSGDGPLIQRLRGTGDLGALVRHLIGVEKKSPTTSALSFDGNLAPLPEPFLVEFTDGPDANGKPCIRLEHQGSEFDAAKAALREAILTAVARTGSHGITKGELEKVVPGKNDRKRAVVDELLDRGVLVQHNGPRGKLFSGSIGRA